MAERYAASIFLFDTVLSVVLELVLSWYETDSAVALKQLCVQSVTVRTRTAAQKLHYFRELIYEDS